VLLGLLVLASANCSPTPEKIGDECDPDGDPCPDGSVCKEGGEDGDEICQVPQGGTCDIAAQNAYCESGYQCVADGKGSGRCGLPEGSACDPAASKCGGNLVCAEIENGDRKCFPPVLINGMVIDLKTEAGIPGAHVLALDELSIAKTDVAVTDEKGNYSLDVPTVRTESGEPTPEELESTFTLRASGAGYQTFPGGLRTALPIDASAAKREDAGWVITTPLTTIALVPLEADQLGRVSISGTVLAGDQSAGVLVVAEGEESASAVSDLSGKYTIFNIANGDYQVKGYAAGIQLEPKGTSVAGADVAGIDLALSDAALGTITGSVNIVNPEGGDATSVVLVVASTFNETFARGDVPRGLRTPLTGTPDVNGAFTIEKVPAGEYWVLAGFENDFLIRDPDPGIAGTQLVKVTMPSPGETVALSDSFKVTGALQIIGPGAEDAEAVSGTPTFQWIDDSSEDQYSIVVYDSYGNIVWEDDMLPSVSGGDVSVPYGGERVAVTNLVPAGMDAEEYQPKPQDTLRLKSARAFVRVDVCDTGPGISAEDRPRIFEPFFTTKASGTGLGLAIVERIVTAHAGDVMVDSGPGGTTFSLLLPLDLEAQPVAALRRNHGHSPI